MKLNRSKLALCLSLVLLLVSAFPVNATTVKDLENKTSGLEDELSDLNKELDSLLSQIQKISSDLEKTRKELAVAKGKEETQYKSMMTRIKYMYENGNTGLLELLFSSNGIVEFVSRAEYISQISKYDRNLLKEFTETRELIAEKEAQLEKDKESLRSLEEDLKIKIKSTSRDLSDYMEQLRAAREEAAKPVEPVYPPTTNSGNSSGGSYKGPADITESGGVNYTESDVELLAALIECEAGSSYYDGMLAVGAVVVNRMKHHLYPNTLVGVVKQSGQFPPATNGTVDKILNRGVKPSCVQAAKDALNGKNNVGDCLSFRSVSSGHAGTVIGGNVFF